VMWKRNWRKNWVERRTVSSWTLLIYHSKTVSPTRLSGFVCERVAEFGQRD